MDLSFPSGVGPATPCAQVGTGQHIPLEIRDETGCDTHEYLMNIPGKKDLLYQTDVPSLGLFVDFGKNLLQLPKKEWAHQMVN